MLSFWGHLVLQSDLVKTPHTTSRSCGTPRPTAFRFFVWVESQHIVVEVSCI